MGVGLLVEELVRITRQVGKAGEGWEMIEMRCSGGVG
jgi:hypothetical protein